MATRDERYQAASQLSKLTLVTTLLRTEDQLEQTQVQLNAVLGELKRLGYELLTEQLYLDHVRPRTRYPERTYAEYLQRWPDMLLVRLERRADGQVVTIFSLADRLSTE